MACAREQTSTLQPSTDTVVPAAAVQSAPLAPAHEMNMSMSEPVPAPDAPVLLPAVLTNAAAGDVYAKASQVPDRLAKMYCYCHCHEERGHVSLLTCFQTHHAEECQVCQHEAMQVWMDWQKGLPVEASQKAADIAFNGGNPPPAS